MTAFIDGQRDAFGVEPICRVLQIAPATYYARKAIARNPDLASDRAKRDLVDAKEIGRVFKASRGRYGAQQSGFSVTRKTQTGHPNQRSDGSLRHLQSHYLSISRNQRRLKTSSGT
jgi:hypothetical protein